MFVEMVVYSGERWRIDDDNLAPYLAVVAELVARHEGQAHWGKNHETIFRDQSQRNPNYAARLARFARVAHCLDPRGVFGTSFARTVGLRPRASGPAPGCDDIARLLTALSSPPATTATTTSSP